MEHYKTPGGFLLAGEGLVPPDDAVRITKAAYTKEKSKHADRLEAANAEFAQQAEQRRAKKAEVLGRLGLSEEDVQIMLGET